MAKTWKEKLNFRGDLPKVVTVTKSMLGVKAGDRMVIVPPIEYDAEMRKVPEGQVKTVRELRSIFAKKYHADTACPLTAGLFINIVAHAAEEASRAGEKDTTPWWRTVKADGELNDKYPGGSEEHARRLRAEGQQISKQGNTYYVDLKYA